jgi:hypothetical protein
MGRLPCCPAKGMDVRETQMKTTMRGSLTPCRWTPSKTETASLFVKTWRKWNPVHFWGKLSNATTLKIKKVKK